MPWLVERNGGTVLLELSAPIDDWDAVRADLLAQFTPRPRIVLLPATIADGTREDEEQLTSLWESLADLGITLQRP